MTTPTLYEKCGFLGFNKKEADCVDPSVSVYTCEKWSNVLGFGGTPATCPNVTLESNPTTSDPTTTTPSDPTTTTSDPTTTTSDPTTTTSDPTTTTSDPTAAAASAPQITLSSYSIKGNHSLQNAWEMQPDDGCHFLGKKELYENSKLTQQFFKEQNIHKSYVDMKKDGNEFKFRDGTSFANDLWAPEEPRNSGENFVELYTGFALNDITGNGERHLIQICPSTTSPDPQITLASYSVKGKYSHQNAWEMQPDDGCHFLGKKELTENSDLTKQFMKEQKMTVTYVDAKKVGNEFKFRDGTIVQPNLWQSGGPNDLTGMENFVDLHSHFHLHERVSDETPLVQVCPN